MDRIAASWAKINEPPRAWGSVAFLWILDVDRIAIIDYEGSIIEVQSDDGSAHLVLNEEHGRSNFEIELHPRADGQPWKVDLKTFRALLDEAERRLSE